MLWSISKHKLRVKGCVCVSKSTPEFPFTGKEIFILRWESTSIFYNMSWWWIKPYASHTISAQTSMYFCSRNETAPPLLRHQTGTWRWADKCLPIFWAAEKSEIPFVFFNRHNCWLQCTTVGRIKDSLCCANLNWLVCENWS